MTSDRIDELIALAALGELSDADRRELDAAAARDPEVASELDGALASAASIQRAPAEDPPRELRNSVLAAIASTPQETPSERPDDDHPDGPEATVDSNSVVRLDHRRSRRRRGASILAAAAVALLAVGGVVLISAGDDTADPIAAVVDAPDATSRSLTGEIGGLTVVYAASEGALVVEGEAVPVLDDTVTYQLWLVDGDGAVSVGIFRPNADGDVAERFGDVDPTDFVLGVTEEPAGGSERPTLPILASA